MKNNDTLSSLIFDTMMHDIYTTHGKAIFKNPEKLSNTVSEYLTQLNNDINKSMFAGNVVKCVSSPLPVVFLHSVPEIENELEDGMLHLPLPIFYQVGC